MSLRFYMYQVYSLKSSQCHYVMLMWAFGFDMCGSRKICQREGVQFSILTTFFFFFFLKRAMTFCWRADDGPSLNAGLLALRYFSGSGPVLLRNPIFCDFSGGGVRTPSPPLDPHMKSLCFKTNNCWKCTKYDTCAILKVL